MLPLRDTICPEVENTVPPLICTTAATVELPSAPDGSDNELKPPDRENVARANADPVNVGLDMVSWSIQEAPPWPRTCVVAPVLAAAEKAVACSAPNLASA